MSKRKVKQGLLNVKDIAKGYTAYANQYDLVTLAPIQCIPLEDKDENWIKWNANWHESVALREIPTKATKLQKFYDMAAGVINKTDYIYNPTGNDISEHLGIIGANNEETLLEMFFPIVPTIINEFIGQFITSDKSVIVDAVDSDSVNEAIEFKTKMMKDIIKQQAMQMKQFELMKSGIIPTNGDDEKSQMMNQYYQSEMENTQKFVDAENQFKKFRNECAKWGNNFIEKFREKFYFNEIELRMFIDSIVADEAILAFNMYDDNFTPQYLEPRKTWVRKSPSKTYYSESNAIVHIDFFSLGEIINMFRKDLTDQQITTLETQYGSMMGNDVLFANQVGHYDSYYDTSKTYIENQSTPANIQEAISDFNVRKFFHNIASGGGSYKGSGIYCNMFGDEKYLRVTQVWWLSQRKYGILTKIEDDGNLIVSEIDENFIVTEKPEYDNSLLKEKTAKTLIKGEHVEWTWIPEWRYVVKIGENTAPNVVNNPSTTQLDSIYLYGNPVRFQFKGANDPYGVKPPVEGRRMSDNTSISNSLVQKLRPWQILYNIVNNKILKLMPSDIGPVLVANESSLKTNSLHHQDGREPLTEFFEGIKDTRMLLNRDLNTGNVLNGKSLPNGAVVIDISTAEKMNSYINMGMMIHDIAYKSIGFTPQALGQVGKKETATGVQQAVQSTDNQIQVYFEKFLNMLMPRIWQTVLEAGQYYTTQSESFADSYITDEGDKVVFSIIKDDLLLRDLLVKPVSTAKIKDLMNKIQMMALQDNTLTQSAKERIHIFKAHTPEEMIEQLDKAEFDRRQHELELQQQQADNQKQLEEMISQREAAQREIEDRHFYDQLANDRYIAELKVNSAPEEPMEDNSISPTDEAKMSQKAETDAANGDIKRQQISQSQKQHDDNVTLKREELAQKDRESQRNYQIAVENKQQADIQFREKQKTERQKIKSKPKK